MYSPFSSYDSRLPRIEFRNTVVAIPNEWQVRININAAITSIARTSGALKCFTYIRINFNKLSHFDFLI